ncbi:MAG TPA: hypothetical protein P5250_06485 [Bacteroidales bacterium]|nr:hypothetical protein [Bacteroidales bacterium]
MKKKPSIFVALPVLDELYSLPHTINSIFKQTFKDYFVYVIVNQPDNWWEDKNKIEICLRNQATLKWLDSLNINNVKIIDRSSKGRGWMGKNCGIGMARKTVMDEIANDAYDDDLIVSLDADTVFNDMYFKTIVDTIAQNTNYVAIAVPYYHKLIDDEIINRAILRYEIYMRYYAINLWRINSPYNFTALGSAIVVPVWVYKKIGGLTPKKGGEDFYFLQKIRKFGPIITYLPEKVYPAARFSNRVDFGTGPAIIKGATGNWQSYPIYHYSFFDDVLETYTILPYLFEQNIDTPLLRFIDKGNKEIWNDLRKNNPDKQKFIKACHYKIDALRILQYLKFKNKSTFNDISDEARFREFIYTFFYNDYINLKDTLNFLNFQNNDIELLNSIRNYLVNKEEQLQQGKLKSIDGKFT